MSWLRARSGEAAAPEVARASATPRARPTPAPASAPAPAEPPAWLAPPFSAALPAVSPWAQLSPVGALSLGLLTGRDLPLLCGPRDRTTFVGRGASNARSAIRLDLPTVSVKHCVIASASLGSYFLIDDSSNGTWVNDGRVPRGLPVPLRDGDVVSLCGPRDAADTSALAFRFTALGEGAAAPADTAQERATAWVGGQLPLARLQSVGLPAAPHPRHSLPPNHRASLPKVPPQAQAQAQPLQPASPKCCRCCACGCVVPRRLRVATPFSHPASSHVTLQPPRARERGRTRIEQREHRRNRRGRQCGGHGRRGIIVLENAA